MSAVNALVPVTVHFLRSKARKRELATYKEIAEAVGTHPPVVPKILWVIVGMCENNGWPQLAALAVKTGSHKPGDDFLEYLYPGMPKNKREENWQKTLEEVFDFDWTRS